MSFSPAEIERFSHQISVIERRVYSDDYWWNAWQYFDFMGDGTEEQIDLLPADLRERYWNVVLAWKDRRNDMVFPVGIPVGISSGRQDHMYRVAEKLVAMVTARGWDPEDIEEVKTLGLIHDTGYGYTDNCQMTHEQVGGEIVRRSGECKYWKEIEMHGVPADERIYSSELLDMLNYCDMTTGIKGQEHTIRARYEDIARRWGKGNIREVNSWKIVEELRDKGYPIDEPFDPRAGILE